MTAPKTRAQLAAMCPPGEAMCAHQKCRRSVKLSKGHDFCSAACQRADDEAQCAGDFDEPVRPRAAVPGKTHDDNEHAKWGDF